MSYYGQGDYYSRGDYYRRGDPFSLGGLVKGIGGVIGGIGKAVGIIPGVGGIAGPVISGVGSVLTGAGGSGTSLSYLPPFPSPGGAGSGIVAYRPPSGLRPEAGITGAVHRMIPGGSSGYFRTGARRMNVTNSKALRRAIRRVSGFGKLVQRSKRAIARANTAVGNKSRAAAKRRFGK